MTEIERLYCQHGHERTIRYLRYWVELERIREAYNDASENFRLPDEILHFATGKLGKGECGEMSSLTFSQAILRGIPTTGCCASSIVPSKFTKLVAGRGGVFSSVFDQEFMHAFVILGVDYNEISLEANGYDLMKMINQIRQGVLVDPFLNIVCKMTNLQQEGRDWFRYLENFKLKSVVKLSGRSGKAIEDPQRFLREIEKIVAPIHVLAKKILQIKERKQSKLPILRFIAQKEADVALDHMHRIFPAFAVRWEKNAKEQLTIWGEGVESDIQTICIYLQANGIHAKVENNKTTQTSLVCLVESDLQKIPTIPFYNPTTHASLTLALEEILRCNKEIEQRRMVSIIASYLA